MCGRWNTVQCFNDLYILDLGTLVWSTLQNATGDKWGPNRWNHSLIAVQAVPHWKLFCFGGHLVNRGSQTREVVFHHCEIVGGLTLLNPKMFE